MHTVMIAVLLMLTGCAATNMQTKWGGKTTSELVDRYGLPNKTMIFEDGEMWEYVGQCGGRATTTNTGIEETTIHQTCKHTTIKVKDGRIVSVKSRYR